MAYSRYLTMANKPRIRFKGFTEDWEQRKLESLFTKYEDKVNTPNSGYWRLGLRSHCKGTFHTYVDAGNELETAEMNRVKSGNFILNITFAWERALAVTNNEDQGKLVSHRFPQFKPNSDLAIDFFKHTLMDKRFQHHLELSSPGGAGRNKVLKVADMLKYELLVPSIKEQNEISRFLNNVDYIITLHQCKLEKLKLTKKALLQKLFPKNGKYIPEIRFKGFTDAWEQRKLDDIAKIKTGGGTPKTANPEYWSGNIPWIQSSDLVEGDIVHVNINKFINNNALKNSAAKLISRDSIALVTRVGVGKVAVINQDFTTSQDFLSLSDFDGSDIKFLAYQLYRLMQENAKVLQGTSIKGITKTELIEQSISIPSSGQEQNLISNVLSKIDSIITLHQRKLERLQEVKKGLLQKMFV